MEDYLPEDEPLLNARRRGEEIGASPIGAAGGAALRFLATLIGARTVVEVGSGCGVSGIWLMRGMPKDAVLTSVDIDPEHQRMAKQAYVEAGLGSFRTRMISGPALEVLPRLTDGAYDLVFCDAQKREYPEYLTDALRLLRPGGVVAFDNALWHDRVADPDRRDPDTEAIREVLRMVRDDERLVPLLVPVGDGLLCAVKCE
ncbi:O-methyltransferase [Spirillospora sp. NPDC048819]|uniref:O-methyltransferase n=1 Tax=Spirillospora sp. NPDC048819 TaxID=3155268 RepID=UPI00340061D4